ncbi:uncharacterized protein LOC124157886 [Ischnura elegans]|uniref:uncharacterized protein LOC124157886 n=1 Tax=Ischnura elegans TaxID=197161 RepID=UPI001ED895F0|nr:uncharacterized protein LOC124157886 [Ischnura elegans]
MLAPLRPPWGRRANRRRATDGGGRLANAVLLIVMATGGVGAFHVKLHAPPYVMRGESAVLTCNHSVDRALLHKVEWLKDGDRKLFQFVRGRNPPFRNFSIPGAKLDWSRSNEREIRLTGLELEASGVYSCEVSMETPIYTKPSNDEVITVIQRQAQDPEVWGRKESYEVGESLEVNCTSAPSHPPAHITWLVNGRPISEKFVKFFRGQWAHPYHHRNNGHHGHHHNLHHHQYRVHSEEENSALPNDGDMQGLTDGDGLDDLEHEPAVLPAVVLAPASSTVQLSYQITEENALEAIESEEIEASSSMKTSEDGMVIGGRITLICMATIPGFLGAGAKEHEYEDHRMTSVDVDIIVPVKSVTEEEEPTITEQEREELAYNGAPHHDHSFLLAFASTLPLFKEMCHLLPSSFSAKAIHWFLRSHGQLSIFISCILTQGCHCR